MNVVELSIAFDPRDLWFQAGYQDIRTQWAYDFDSAARALEKFLVDDCAFSPIQRSAKTAMGAASKVVIHLDEKASQSLQGAASEEGLTLIRWLQKTLGASDVDVRS